MAGRNPLRQRSYTFAQTNPPTHFSLAERRRTIHLLRPFTRPSTTHTVRSTNGKLPMTKCSSPGHTNSKYVLNPFSCDYYVEYKFVEAVTATCNQNFLGIEADDRKPRHSDRTRSALRDRIAIGEFSSFHDRPRSFYSAPNGSLEKTATGTRRGMRSKACRIFPPTGLFVVFIHGSLRSRNRGR
jgi:hypothetical protein